MAQFYLLNSILVGRTQRWAGELVTDTSEDLAALRAAGAILWSGGDSSVVAAAAIAQSMKRRGSSPAQCAAVMAASASWSNGQNAGRGVYGGADDGLAIFDGVKTYPSFATLSNGVYTLTRDTFLDNGTTVLVGVNLDTGGYKLFVSGTLYNYGVIQNNGNDAVTTTPGASTRTGGSCGIGMGGGTSGNNANGGNGGTPSAQNQLNDVAAVGGAGGASPGHTGGLGGTYTGGAPGDGGADYLLSYLSGMTFNASANGVQATVDTIGGGAGGGGGASSQLTSFGGAGGGGGGVLILCALDLVNYGTISANGGRGGNASGTGDAGGGGGGGGGIACVLHRYLSGPGVITASGGQPGTAIGAGSPGVVGGPGEVMSIYH